MSNKPFVVLIHGLHQRGFIMSPLAKYLQKQGFRTHRHDYHSLLEPVAKHSWRLNVWLETHHNPDVPIYMVGHSLGGLVMRDFIVRYPKWKIANCVTLGTPHIGSVSADYIKKLAAPLVGRSYRQGLDGTVAPLPDEICMGVIAGCSPYGLGQILLSHHQRKEKLTGNECDNDGTVYVAETRLPNAADHIVLDVSHTGMLMNEQVAQQTAYFLTHGQFNHKDLS